VLLVDDHTVVRQALRSLLTADPGIEVVGEAENGRQAVRLVQKLRPDIVIMDVAMPHLNGLEAMRQIVKEGTPTKILVLSSCGDYDYVHQFTEAGVAGYLIKQTAANELIAAIYEVSRGNAYFSPSVSRRILDYYREALLRGRPLKKRQEQLSSRGFEVLQLVAEGALSKQIASDLCISVKTVEKHRQQIMNVLNIHDIPGLTRYAVAKGIIEISPRLTSPTPEVGMAASTPA